MKQDVCKPLYKICRYKEDEQLRPYSVMTDIDQSKFPEISTHKIFKEQFRNIWKGYENDQFKYVEIEEHVEGIKPEILPNEWLIFSPWKDNF